MRVISCLLLIAFAGCSEDPDDAPAPDAQPGETTNPADIAAPDTWEPPDVDEVDVPDVQPPPPGPWANVFESNPIDSPATIEVLLANLDSEDGTLTGSYASVRGCTPDLEKGEPVPVDVSGFTLTVTLCTPAQTAIAGADGSYRHIVPPEDHGAGDDAFAEVMMYHHIQVIHDYFKDVHGFLEMDFPLDAVVNLQAYLQVPGLCDAWSTLPNAAFLPPGSLGELPIPIPLDPEAPHIVFSGSSTKDFAYDAGVIYHEYSHATIGESRLSAVFLDSEGLNNLPYALNEGYADYFAGTVLDDPVMGGYALTDTEPLTICGVPLGGGGGDHSRDLTEWLTCPNDLTGEVHADGHVFAAALWAIRVALGHKKADGLIATTVAGFASETDFEGATLSTIAEAQATLSAEDAATVEEILAERGLIGCHRVLPVDRVGARGIPLQVEGGSSGSPFGGATPGYLQLGVELPPGTTEVVMTVKLGSGGLFGGGGGSVAFDALWKPGTEPVLLDPEAGTTDAVVVTPAEELEGSVWSLRLAGGCLTEGAWTLALMNHEGGLTIESATLETKQTEPDGPPTPGCD